MITTPFISLPEKISTSKVQRNGTQPTAQVRRAFKQALLIQGLQLLSYAEATDQYLISTSLSGLSGCTMRIGDGISCILGQVLRDFEGCSWLQNSGFKLMQGWKLNTKTYIFLANYGDSSPILKVLEGNSRHVCYKLGLRLNYDTLTA